MNGLRRSSGFGEGNLLHCKTLLGWGDVGEFFKKISVGKASGVSGGIRWGKSSKKICNKEELLFLHLLFFLLLPLFSELLSSFHMPAVHFSCLTDPKSL